MAKRTRKPKKDPKPKQEIILPEAVRMQCPVCQTQWGEARIEFGQAIESKQFTPREGFKGKIKFQQSGLPICPVCNFKYDDRAMYGLLIAAANGRAIGMGEGGWDK